MLQQVLEGLEMRENNEKNAKKDATALFGSQLGISEMRLP